MIQTASSERLIDRDVHRGQDVAAVIGVEAQTYVATLLARHGPIIGLIRRLSDRAADRSGRYTIRQIELLLSISSTAQVTDQVTLARLCGIDTATTGAVIDRLEHHGVLTRMVNPADKRRHLVMLTADGVHARKEALKTFRCVQNDFLAPLDQSERGFLRSRLSRIVACSHERLPAWTRDRSAVGQAATTLFRRAAQLQHQVFRTRMAPLSLTQRQLGALQLLRDRPGLNHVSISAAMAQDVSTTSIVLRNLLRRKLVRQINLTTDLRTRSYIVTAQGEEMVRQMLPRAKQAAAYFLSDVSHCDITTLSTLLPKLAAGKARIVDRKGAFR